MIGPRTVLMILYVVEACLLVGLSVPLIFGRVAPNSWYGFRVKRTLEDASIWYPANRYAAQQLIGLGLTLIVVSLSLYFVPSVSFTTYAVSCLTVTLVGLTIAIIRSFRFLRRLPN